MFSDFHGNAETVGRLRAMAAAGRFPHSLILAGPRGAGKYTLAQMLAKTLNCLNPPAGDLPDFCGECGNCVGIAQSDDLRSRVAEAVEARDSLRDTDRKETRILVQSHPDVLIIPPDPPQLMIKVDQVRHLTSNIYRLPASGRRRLFIFTDSVFMKEAANALLKALEEPPEYAGILLLTTNPGSLLTTIRSRCLSFSLLPLPAPEMESWLAAKRPQWTPAQRTLAARLSGGALGRALMFDVAAYSAARKDALALLNAGIRGGDHAALFRVTETYRAGAEGREKTEELIATLYSLLHDLAFLNSGAPELVRNIDIRAELQHLTAMTDFRWITLASEELNEVQRNMRRNVLRGLSLDAFATSLARSGG